MHCTSWISFLISHTYLAIENRAYLSGEYLTNFNEHKVSNETWSHFQHLQTYVYVILHTASIEVLTHEVEIRRLCPFEGFSSYYIVKIAKKNPKNRSSVWDFQAELKTAYSLKILCRSNIMALCSKNWTKLLQSRLEIWW